MLTKFVFSASLLLASVTTALCCPGQTGKAIFSDDFSDSSGGWDLDANETIAQGTLQITADPKTESDGSQNLTFNATEGDYCVDIVFPSTAADPQNGDYASLTFLGTDYDNRYAFDVDTTGEAWVSRKVKGNWLNLIPAAKVDGIKTAPGSENVLRVVIKDQRLTFYINGTQWKVLRAQVSDDANRFGFFAGTDNKPPADKRVYTVKSYDLTQAQ